MRRSGSTRRLRRCALAAGVGVFSLGLPAATTVAGAATYDPRTDAGSSYAVTQATGARRYWQAGFTGAGIGVAVIDSGVSPVDGLSAPGKVVNGPDLSFESQAPHLTRLDTFGHGTHMAGIIAGRADAAAAGRYATDTANFLGMAPDAHIVSVKVADSQGATDVSQVIAAIDWVVEHRNDPGLNIRVLNLSYGTNTDQPYEVDPLAFAVERAWRAGIFVVVAAGNAGFVGKKTSSMTAPAYSPNIMAVAASDANGTMSTKDDTVPTFSSGGAKSRRPDMVAPGAHIVSLRVPGSFLDQRFAGTGAVTPQLFRGSGTSQAAAVVSGAAALVIQQHPRITPDQVKRLLTKTAHKLHGVGTERQGSGALDLAAALDSDEADKDVKTKPKFSTGAGSLEAARGSNRLVLDGVTLQGERDIFGRPFDARAIALAAAAGRSWSGGTWNGSTWSGSTWSGSTWSGSTWSGSTWSGSTWSGSTWSGSTWSGSTWSGSTWSGSTWSGSTWSGSTWSGSTWSGGAWLSFAPSGSTWLNNWSSAGWS